MTPTATIISAACCLCGLLCILQAQQVVATTTCQVGNFTIADSTFHAASPYQEFLYFLNPCGNVDTDGSCSNVGAPAVQFFPVQRSCTVLGRHFGPIIHETDSTVTRDITEGDPYADGTKRTTKLTIICVRDPRDQHMTVSETKPFYHVVLTTTCHA